MKIKDWLAILIPSIITIVGLYVSYRQNKKNLEYEIKKTQKTFTIDKIDDVFNNLLDLIFNQNNSEKNTITEKRVHAVITGIYKYGSSDSIRLIAEWQQFNYLSKEEQVQNYSSYYALALYFFNAYSIKI